MQITTVADNIFILFLGENKAFVFSAFKGNLYRFYLTFHIILFYFWAKIKPLCVQCFQRQPL